MKTRRIPDNVLHEFERMFGDPEFYAHVGPAWTLREVESVEAMLLALGLDRAAKRWREAWSDPLDHEEVVRRMQAVMEDPVVAWMLDE